MKRSGFKKPEFPSKTPISLTPIRQIEVQPAKLPVQTPKFEYVRSPNLLRACGMLPCQHCDSCAGSAGAHSNWSIHGKGRGIKATDSAIAAMCAICHYELDQGNIWSEDEKKSIWHAAHVKTVQKLVILKAWPQEVPIPNLEFPEEWT